MISCQELDELQVMQEYSCCPASGHLISSHLINPRICTLHVHLHIYNLQMCLEAKEITCIILDHRPNEMSYWRAN